MGELLRRRAMMGASVESLLPEGYKKVARVGKNDKSNSRCHIDTGYVANSNTRISVDYMYIGGVSSANQLMGSASTGDGLRGVILFFSGLRWGKGWLNLPTPSDGSSVSDIVWFDGTRAHAIRNGVEYQYTPTAAISARESIYLLGRHQVNTVYGNSPAAMVSGLRIWDDGVLVRDFIPCVRKIDGRAGFYDLTGSVSSETGTPFYTNMVGTTNLTWEA